MTVKSDSTLSKKETALIVCLAVIAMIVTTVAVVPALRTSFKEALSFDKRQIVAKVSGKLTENGPEVTVLKIASNNSLHLEVFDLQGTDGMTLIAKIPLVESRDGYFLVKGNSTNLTLADVDNDSTLEIVAPTYDEQMVPRLNIYKFNSATRGFDKISAPEH